MSLPLPVQEAIPSLFQVAEEGSTFPLFVVCHKINTFASAKKDCLKKWKLFGYCYH